MAEALKTELLEIEPLKFDQLRLKTERQLVQLVNNRLDRGIRQARHALLTSDTFAETAFLGAKEAHAEVSRLILLVEQITEDQRGRWEARLKYFRELLDGLAALGSRHRATEDDVPVLARALWKARGCPEGSADDDWLRAERALKSQKAHDAVSCAG